MGVNIIQVETLPHVTLLGEDEFCRIYGYSKTQIEQRIKAGDWLLGCEYFRDGKMRKFDIRKVEEWLRKQNQAA